MASITRLIVSGILNFTTLQKICIMLFLKAISISKQLPGCLVYSKLEKVKVMTFSSFYRIRSE